LTSPRMYQVMDLCISCKACKAECPSSVDMAKIKTEFLAQYHAANGTPLRDKLLGNIGRISRLASGPLAHIVNFGAGNPLSRRLLGRLVGISPQRTLPAFARQPFTDWFAQRHSPPSAQKVVLFNDTFNTYNDPHIAIAATRFLEAVGFEVILPGHGCCGRPFISKGLVAEARAAAADTVARLLPYARQGLPIIGLEPSCLLSLKDEYLYLLPNRDEAQLVANQALMFEEFVAQLAEQGQLDVTFTDQSRQLLLHGHCHQKALVGTAPSHQILQLPPNYRLTEVDSGCCGMAGSFGYEAEHYEISLKMAERRLLPAVRAAAADTLIVAAGTSCRHQVADATGRMPLHPAEVLWQAIKD